MRTIRLVDVEVGDLLQVSGHTRAWLVIGLDRIRDEVRLDFWEADGGGYRNRVFRADEVIGHLREYKPNCYRLVWSRNKSLITKER